MHIKQLLKHLYTLPWTPGGRRMRIGRLMNKEGLERDVAAAIVYYRDSTLLSNDELKDFNRICDRLKKGNLTMPADKVKR